MLHSGRHARPRARSTVLLPTLLLLGGSALTGLAVLPVPASASAPALPPLTASLAPPLGGPSALDDPEPGAARRLPWDSRVGDEKAARRTASTTAAWARAAEAAARRKATALRASRARRAAASAQAAAREAARPVPQVARPGVGGLTSGFGPRWGRLHAGIDLASGIGAPVSAVAGGVVESAGSEGGYGLVVRVRHGEGTVSVYAHLSELLVAAGQPVRAGTLLGREGNSGQSTGPHLHFEIRIGDVPVDPLPWLRERGLTLGR